MELTDDVDGTPATETVTFELDGKTYEIDLSEKNAKAIRKALEPWITSARQTSRRRRGTPSRTTSTIDTAAIRAWAESNGIELSPRGRLPKDVITKYQAATS